jgi:3',5'-nucleoside bisphosphate phosphatase
MIDLHVHTACSDGSTHPADLIEQAHQLGIEALAIADHDTLGGYDAARHPAERVGLELICAVELSTRHVSHRLPPGTREPSVHVLAYFPVSPPTSAFRAWLQAHQETRRQRNIALVEKLQNLGVNIALSDAAIYGHNQIGRPHFARVLLEKGYVSTLQEAFDVYLAENAKAGVERDQPALEDSIRCICDAGGLASLAHPARLQQTEHELTGLVARLVDLGLRGLEVYHSEHSPAHSAAYRGLARYFDLVQTGGSDYHGSNKPLVHLGTGTNRNLYLSYSLLEQMKERCYAKR